MRTVQTLLALTLSLSFVSALHAQNSLKDGTALLWDKEINVGHDSLLDDTVKIPALTIPIYEASSSEVMDLLKSAMPDANFKKQGNVMKASGASFTAASSTPTDILASVTENKKQRMSTLTLAFVKPTISEPVEGPQVESATRDLAVKLNKAVVQQQIDTWKKKLSKASDKTDNAVKDHDKAKAQKTKSQAKLEKSTKEKSKLQDEHSILQQQIDLDNQKWTLSQDPKDLKTLTNSRKKITKNESEMAKVMSDEANMQKDLSKNADDVPDAQKESEQKTAAQADVQRTVDALQQKMESIR